jgi:DNA transposition AAA+ family ATPase
MKRLPDWIEALANKARIGGARVLRDDGPFSLEAGAEVAKRLEEFRYRRNMTQGQVARAMGIEAVDFSKRFNAADETLLRAIDKWLEEQEIRRRGGKAAGAGVALTSVVEHIFAGARFAGETACIVLAHGPAGIGKTVAAQAIQSDTPGALYIRISTMGQTALAVMEEIALADRIPLSGSRAALFRKLQERFMDSGRLLLVDEIHKLEGRRHDEALHALRDLHDATGIPMLWLGMSNLAAYIQAGHASGYEPLDQLHSRIGLWLDLNQAAAKGGGGGGGHGGGGPGLATLEDVRRFLALRQLRISPEGEAYLLALVNQVGGGGYRALDKLLKLAAKLAGSGEITAEILRGLQAARLGDAAAAALETRMETPTVLVKGCA